MVLHFSQVFIFKRYIQNVYIYRNISIKQNNVDEKAITDTAATTVTQICTTQATLIDKTLSAYLIIGFQYCEWRIHRCPEGEPMASCGADNN